MIAGLAFLALAAFLLWGVIRSWNSPAAVLLVLVAATFVSAVSGISYVFGWAKP